MGSPYDFLEGPDEEPDGHNYFYRPNRKYGCNNCHQPITFDRVLYMSKISSDQAFTIGYVCRCTNEKSLMETRLQVDRQAMKNLLGSLRPHLPYRASPGPYLSLGEELEKRLKVAAFDLDGCVGVDDLLLYIDGPGSNRTRGQ